MAVGGFGGLGGRCAAEQLRETLPSAKPTLFNVLICVYRRVFLEFLFARFDSLFDPCQTPSNQNVNQISVL
jgi:hypothetical protein